jgi:hypothetical protein
MDEADSKRARPTRKEIARQIRREAYQKAKAFRAADPRYAAMKESMKERRRSAYQRAKAQRKLAAAEKKADELQKRADERATADKELMGMVRRFTERT